MTPWNVKLVTNPRSHKTSRMTNIVHNISASLSLMAATHAPSPGTWGAETGPFPVQRCCKTQEEASVGAAYDRAFFLESNEIRAVIQNGGNGGTNTCTHLPR